MVQPTMQAHAPGWTHDVTDFQASSTDQGWLIAWSGVIDCMPATAWLRRTAAKAPWRRPDRAARVLRAAVRTAMTFDAICALWPAMPRHALGIPPPTLPSPRTSLYM